jgi:hypothetical protein
MKSIKWDDLRYVIVFQFRIFIANAASLIIALMIALGPTVGHQITAAQFVPAKSILLVMSPWIALMSTVNMGIGVIVGLLVLEWLRPRGRPLHDPPPKDKEPIPVPEKPGGDARLNLFQSKGSPWMARGRAILHPAESFLSRTPLDIPNN